ncbi:hypothetical protein M3221_24365 [Domibacillus indicus]|uniref:hypothetical protein n=1 Tax=Domibacillus indicus TaxID=1437523 RepID=UPI00203F1457|nr:hypothetical protein [Domibacillus indicus]MCM3791462.1 hypothetical protein [Domibacillus indicus]
MDHLRQVDWHTIATYTNCVFVVNKEKPEEYVVLIYPDKQDFDAVEVYVDIDQDSGRVTYYKILQKITDGKGNLIFLAEKEE